MNVLGLLLIAAGGYGLWRWRQSAGGSPDGAADGNQGLGLPGNITGGTVNVADSSGAGLAAFASEIANVRPGGSIAVTTGDVVASYQAGPPVPVDPEIANLHRLYTESIVFRCHKNPSDPYCSTPDARRLLGLSN